MTADDTAASVPMSASDGRCSGTISMSWKRWNGKSWVADSSSTLKYEYEYGYLKIKV